MKTERNISAISSGLVFILYALAMAISYDAMRSLAAANGYAGWRSYIMPFIVDLGITVFSISVLRSELLQEKRSAASGWVLVVVYTAVSVVFNVGHVAEHIWTGWRFVFAVAVPLTLFFSFERLMAQFKSMTQRSATLFSLSELQEKQEQANIVLVQLNSEAEQLTEQIARLRSEVAELETTKEIATLNDTQQAIIGYVNSLPNGAETLQQIADNVERSKSTVSKYVNELVQLGVFSWNGTIKAKVE